MDERALTELLECSVCLEQLDATSKVLQCQHTFCRRCLEEIVATKNELRCPECRMLVEIRVDELPSNILLIRLLEGLKNCKAGITGQASSANSSPSHTQPSSPGSAAGGARTSPIHKVRLKTCSQGSCSAREITVILTCHLLIHFCSIVVSFEFDHLLG